MQTAPAYVGYNLRHQCRQDFDVIRFNRAKLLFDAAVSHGIDDKETQSRGKL